MKLLESQENTICEIVKIINEMNNANAENRFNIINIIGDKGIGKSTIANEILLRLPNKWRVHQIIGNDRDETEGANINTTRRIEFYPNPGFSLRIGIVSLSSTFRFQESDSIFKDIEKQYLRDIKKDCGYSVIFVDNYENLDNFTRKFVNTISSYDRIDKFYKHFPVLIIITSEKRVFGDDEIKVFKAVDITEKDIERIGENNLSNSRIKQIKLLSGNNLKFVNMLVNSDIDTLESVSHIIDKRLDEISKISQINNKYDIEDICVCGAYFEHGFTAEHVFNVIQKYSIEQIYELFINLNKYLIFENKSSIINFSVEDFKHAFIARRIDFEQIYFNRMANFYQKYYDYKYNTRANFEYRIFLHNNNPLNKDKAIALIFMGIVTLIYERKITQQKEIEDKLSKFYNIDFPQNLKEILFSVVDNKVTFEQLDSLVLSDYDNILAAEIMRMKLIVMQKTVYETEKINNNIITAISYAKDLAFDNDEKYLLITLQDAIVSAIVNRSTLFALFDKEIKSSLEYIKKYKYVNGYIYNEYINRYKRKSALHLNCDMSIRNLKDAIAHFEANKNVYELFNCYVNLLGVYSVSSGYKSSECKNYCEKFENFLKSCKITFPEQYKCQHNKYLLDFLSQIYDCNKDVKYISLAKNFYQKYKSLNDKVNKNVVRLNQVSLCCVFDESKAENEINSFIYELSKMRNSDHFYLINLLSLKCSLLIIKREWQKAEGILELMGTYEFPIFNSAERYYKKRMETLKIIIDNKITCSSILEYDKLIYNINSQGLYGMPIYFGEEIGWNFYSKMFIMTDVQFFS